MTTHSARVLVATGLLILTVTLSEDPAPAAPPQGPLPRLSETDRIRLAEARRLSRALGEQLWAGWEKAPSALLLVSSDHEFLLWHPAPSAEFSPLGHDDLLDSDVWFRDRRYDTRLLATFPAVGGLPTVVIGQAENTSAATSTPWVLTVLHEHFHQLQYSQPGYYEAVNGLGLARGDRTGMWMLNYDFPYTRPEVAEHFKVMAARLAQALEAEEGPGFSRAVRSYLEARRRFRSLLREDDYRYFVFQEWQEGIARYTEYRLARLAASGLEPSSRFRALEDFTPLANEARRMRERILSGLRSADLALGPANRLLPLRRRRRSASGPSRPAVAEPLLSRDVFLGRPLPGSVTGFCAGKAN